ncbi:MAG: adenine phosphoribosyltransferase [Planctomycetaceae bacterium]
MSSHLNLKEHVRSIPDFPSQGIMFRDITPMLKSAVAMKEVIRRMADPFRGTGITTVIAAEARGFVFGVPLAMELDAGFVPVRKPGKLPFDTHEFSYELEYGMDTLEMHTDAVQKGDRVLLVDDLLATGGTIEACLKLAENLGAEIAGAAFVIELAFLRGRERLGDHQVVSLIEYHSTDSDE